MLQIEKDRIGEALLALQNIDIALSNLPMRLKQVITFLETKTKDKAADKKDHDTNVGKRIPATKALLKSVEAARPVISAGLTTKHLDQYEDGKAFLQASGAGMLNLAADVYNKWTAFFATISGAEGVPYKNEHSIKTVNTMFNHWQAELAVATKLFNALRTPPARPAGAAPPKPH